MKSFESVDKQFVEILCKPNNTYFIVSLVKLTCGVHTVCTILYSIASEGMEAFQKCNFRTVWVNVSINTCM